MKRIIFPILLLMLPVFSCKSNKEKRASKKEQITVAKTEGTETSLMEIIDFKQISIDRAYQWPRETAPFNIVNQEISSDFLILTVEYGGGCKEHFFKMNSTGAWMKSMPPKMNLWLEHENNDDNCRALIQEKLYFDLKPLRYQSSNQVIFIINGEEEKTVSYSYR